MDGTLIAGKRRLAACKKLGWQTVPIRMVNLDQISRGEFAENAYRKGFLPSEIYEIWQELEPAERAAAKGRQKATRFGSGGGNFPPPSKGKTRDKVAAFAGVSGRNLNKIAEVVRAAEADSRFAPLVKQMDQCGHVDGAYRQLQAMRAAAKANENTSFPSSESALAHKISVAALDAAFPQYPITIEDKGWILGVWYCGTSWQKSRLHGEYPPTFLDRALALFPEAKRIAHCPSGTVLGPGLTIDLVRDDVRCPQIIANAAELPLPSGSADLMLSDPPYTEEDSTLYGCAPFPLKDFPQGSVQRRLLGDSPFVHSTLSSQRVEACRNDCCLDRVLPCNTNVLNFRAALAPPPLRSNRQRRHCSNTMLLVDPSPKLWQWMR
jgi:hypothetical protein